MTLDLEHLVIPAQKRNFVRNPFFKEWNDLILKNIKKRPEYDDDKRSYDAEDQKLINECNFHIKHFSKNELDKENVLLLMHPLYKGISHSDKINFFQYSDSRNYDKALIKILGASSRNYNVVLGDTVHFFGDTTSLLTEHGIVEKNFLTEYDSGVPMDNRILEWFDGKNVFSAGAYHGVSQGADGIPIVHCLTTFMRLLHKRGKANIYAVNDLIVNFPSEYSEYLKPEGIVIDRDRKANTEIFLPKEKVLSLNDFYNFVK